MPDESPVPKVITNRATIEDLLGLPPEGWEAIAKMTDEELAVYLKDITDLEPKIPEGAQLCGVKPPKIKKEKKQKDFSLLDDDSVDSLEDDGDENPIKLNKTKKPGKKLGLKEKNQNLDREAEELFEDL